VPRTNKKLINANPNSQISAKINIKENVLKGQCVL